MAKARAIVGDAPVGEVCRVEEVEESDRVLDAPGGELGFGGGDSSREKSEAQTACKLPTLLEEDRNFQPMSRGR